MDRKRRLIMNEVIQRPEAAYDPAGTTIQLSYDPEFNLLENPTIIHELTHFSQNIITSLGINQTFMFNELYYSTCQILLSDIQAKMPLAQHKFNEEKPIFWEHGELAILFQKDVIGKLSVDELGNFESSLRKIKSNLLKITYKPGTPNPFYFKFKGREPGFGIKLNDIADLFFRLDGHFVQEIHARSTEFIIHWSQEKLNIDDAVTYFLHNLNNPYTLFYLAVSKLITERTGRVFFDVQDSVFLCHLCSLIALAYTELDDSNHFIEREIRTTRIKFRYIAPGEIFLNVFSAALDQFVEPGWVVSNYFNLMEAVLTKLHWPKFDQMMNTTIDNVNRFLEGHIQSTNNNQSGGYNTYLFDKWLSSAKAIKWLLERYKQRVIMEFIRAPILIVKNGIVRGPLIAGPIKYSIILQEGETGNNADTPPPEMIRGMLIAHLTYKLWFENDLSCFDSKGSTLKGSVIGCEDACRCKKELEISKQGPICNNNTWLKFLSTYPGLSSRIDNIKIVD